MDTKRYEENATLKNWAGQAIEEGAGSQAFDEARKIAALGAMLEDDELPPATAAAEADGAVYGQSQAYQAGLGKISDEEATENVADRKTAEWIPLARDYLAEWAQKGCIALGTAIGERLGNPEAGAKIGEALGQFLNEDVKKLIEIGLRQIVKAANHFCVCVKEKAPTWLEKARNWMQA